MKKWLAFSQTENTIYIFSSKAERAEALRRCEHMKELFYEGKLRLLGPKYAAEFGRPRFVKWKS